MTAGTLAPLTTQAPVAGTGWALWPGAELFVQLAVVGGPSIARYDVSLYDVATSGSTLTWVDLGARCRRFTLSRCR